MKLMIELRDGTWRVIRRHSTNENFFRAIKSFFMTEAKHV